MTQEHGVAGGPHDHTDHGEPNVSHALWRVGTVSYTKHVTHGHKQGVGVLKVPCRILGKNKGRGHSNVVMRKYTLHDYVHNG